MIVQWEKAYLAVKRRANLNKLLLVAAAENQKVSASLTVLLTILDNKTENATSKTTVKSKHPLVAIDVDIISSRMTMSSSLLIHKIHYFKKLPTTERIDCAASRQNYSRTILKENSKMMACMARQAIPHVRASLLILGLSKSCIVSG